MSAATVILSPVPAARLAKAVANCQGQAEATGLVAPVMTVLEEVDLSDLADAMSSDDEELLMRVADVQAQIRLEHDTELAGDPLLTATLAFLVRRGGQSIVQLGDSVMTAEAALEHIAQFPTIEGFDHREEARRLQARLLRIKYRLLAKRWADNDTSWIPTAVSNSDIEAYERNARLTLPADFRGYLAVVGTGPGPSTVGVLPFDEMEKPKTHRKSAARPKLGKTVHVGNMGEQHYHILVTEGDCAGSIWELNEGTLGASPIANDFLGYVEGWIGSGELEAIGCGNCQGDLSITDLERGFCSACGTRLGAQGGENRATKAFEEFAIALIERLIDEELLELEEPDLAVPLVAALTDYMGEKGHKWKSPDRASASIAGWLLHRDEVAELHGTNADIAQAFIAVSNQ